MGLNGFAAYRGPVKARIDAEFARRLGEWFPGLPRPQQDALQEMLANGKRIRGVITCLVAEARGALEPFPDNECTRLLAQIPDELVRIAA